MFKENFDELFITISDFPFEGLGNLSGKLRNKCEKSLSKSRKNFISIFTIIIGYYLFSNAIIDKVGLGPFRIENINFILYFMPVVVSFFLESTLSNLYKSSKLNYMIYRIELRQFGFSKRNKLIALSLPTEESFGSIKKPENQKKKGCSSGCAGCFTMLPTLVIVIAALLVIPLIYVFVIYYTVSNYSITFFDCRLLYWIPSLFTFIFLFNSTAPLIKLFKFAKFRNSNIEELGDVSENN
ncbi:MAG: hypothetical protein AAFZ89_13285 [Bacteroidota bacterium]